MKNWLFYAYANQYYGILSTGNTCLVMVVYIQFINLAVYNFWQMKIKFIITMSNDVIKLTIAREINATDSRSLFEQLFFGQIP